MTEYFSELNSMWEQMDFFDPLAMTCSADALAFTNWLGKRRTFRFLAGLNSEFEQIRQSLWQRNPLPALRDAFAVVVQEESRRKAMIPLPVQESSAMFSLPHTVSSQGDKVCDHCHRRNHTRETCWDLHGRPARGRGRDSGRGRGQGRGRGPGRGGGYQKAHVADSISMLGSSTDDMVTQLVTQLAARLLPTTSASSASPISGPSGADGYILSSLLTTVVRPVGTIIKALIAESSPDRTWIVDSGASKHMTPDPTMFKTYKPMSGREKVQTADGSLCSIAGVGDVTCTPDLQLSSVLHVPNFTNNLLSVSQLVDDLNCVVSLSPTHVVLQEPKTGKVIGIGKRSEGLYRLKQGGEVLDPRACLAETPELEMFLLHSRLGHISFTVLGRLYPKLYSKCSKTKLVCDACEFAKHTRTMYPSFGNRSLSCFDIVHSDVWGPSRVTTLSGSRWFVTFIDCYSRMTWLYLLRSKEGVLECFKTFHKMVETQFEKKVKVLRSDNGTEYTNRAMQDFLRGNGIVHQTTCVNTPEQNGVAERKNRHILEVTRCLLFAMNVPRYLWGEAVQTATYLINRMPLRAVDFSTPLECSRGPPHSRYLPRSLVVCALFITQVQVLANLMRRPTNVCLLGTPVGKRGIDVMTL